jgi:hypothetical protein
MKMKPKNQVKLFRNGASRKSRLFLAGSGRKSYVLHFDPGRRNPSSFSSLIILQNALTADLNSSYLKHSQPTFYHKIDYHPVVVN